MAGQDMVILEEHTGPPVTVTGIADTELTDLPTVTAAGLIRSKQGPIIGIFNQYAKYGARNSIHSPIQMGSFGIDVNEKSNSVPGGRQSIITPEGYTIPLRIKHGLAYMDMEPPDEDQLSALPHVQFTSNEIWNPSDFDNNSISSEESDSETQYAVFQSVQKQFEPKSILPKKLDYQKLRPYFNYAPVARIRETLKHTTQWFRAENHGHIRKHTKARFPAASVPHLAEDYAFDTWFSNTTAAAVNLPGHKDCTMVTL